MKLETAVIITKGFCLTYIPLGTALSAGLPETGMLTIWGLPMKFWTLLIASTVAAAGGLLAFLSQSFGTYMSNRPDPTPVIPSKPPVPPTP